MGAFVRDHGSEILPEWVKAVRECAPAMRLPEAALVDHLPLVLSRIAEAADRISHGEWSTIPSKAAIEHAMTRLAEGFEVGDVLTELFLLRHVLLQHVLSARPPSDRVSDAQLLSWAIDAAIRESIGAFAAAQQRTLRALDRISAEALTSETTEEFLRRLLAALLHSVKGIDMCCVLLVEGDLLIHRIAVGCDEQRHERVAVPMGEGLVGRVAAGRQPLSESAQDDLSPEGELLRSFNIRWMYAVPLLANGEVLGVVQCCSRTLEKFPDDDLTLFRSAAERAAAALRQQRLREEATRAAIERDKALRQRQVALDAAGMGWWSYDSTSRRASWDGTYSRIFGIQGTTAPVEDTLRFIHPADLPGVWERVERALDPSNPQAYRAEYRIVRSDGSVRWIEAHGLPVNEEEGSEPRITGLIGTVSDITDRKDSEAALQEADRQKNEFIAMLSHELRNPLAPIRQSVYILARAAPGSEQAHRATTVIDRQVDHLARLVEDLLDVTRIERGKIRLVRSRVDLVAMVRKVLEDYQRTLEGFQVEVALPEAPVWLNADPTRVEQVLGNLLHNAAKFTPKGSRISCAVARHANAAVLEVADAGVGIEPEMLPRIFDAFAQAERSLARTKGGLGLGLALVKGLVELHGGTVAAFSGGLGQGARFTVSLPLASPPSAEAPLASSRDLGFTSRRILVIDDNRDGAETLRMALELAGHEVEVAFDGTSGLAKARDSHPEVILCDIGLPDMDGYALATALRRDAQTASAFLVAFTGYAQPEDLRRALDAGFEAHLVKPPNMDLLSRMLQRLDPRA